MASPECVLDLFMEYTKGMPSPEIFRKWGALSLIAGALERRVFATVMDVSIAPNLWVLLVAPPGVGKSTVIKPVYDLWAGAGKFNVAPSSMTKAAFEQQLVERPRVFPNGDRHNAMNIASSEFGVLVPAHDLEFLNTLNDIYDCGKIYERRTKMDGSKKVEYPHLNMIAGTQPKYLGEILPESAYGMGFTSRMIMVYAGVGPKVNLFGGISKSDSLRKLIIKELQRLEKLCGEFRWDNSAMEVISSWHMADCPPAPTHSKLQSYNPRRIIHAVKLSMVYSAARSNSLVISEADVTDAIEQLTYTELFMPEIFKDMNTNSDAQVIQEAYNYLIMQWTRKKKPIREHMLVVFLHRHVPAQKIPYVIKTMIDAKMIEENPDGTNFPEPNRLFKPLAYGELDE